MTRHSVVFAVAALLASTAAFAQTAPAPTPAPAAGPALTRDGKPLMKDVRAQCRTEARGSGLKGDARRQALADCVVKQRPDKADAMKCRMDPSLKGLDKDARRAAIKACVAKAKA